MSNYIGNQPSLGEFKRLDSIASSFDGSTTTFSLTYNTTSQAVGDAAQLIVSLNGIIQEPLESYTLTSGGNSIVFSAAPASGDTCHIVYLGGVGQVASTISDNSVSTAKIADNAVDSTKLDETDSYTVAGLTTTGNVNFGDGNTINLGDSSEFKIYHTSSGNSIISETGAGSLYLDAANLYLRNGTASGENYIACTSDGGVSLYYDNSPKLSTSGSGVNVVGNLTASSGLIGFDGGDNITFTNNSFATINVNSVGRATFATTHTTFNENGDDVDFRVESDTKTHALFVQGSDGYVGIGTDSPTAILHTVSTNVLFDSDTYGILELRVDNNDDQTNNDGIIKITTGSASLTKAEFRYDESEDLVHISYGDHGRNISINSSGNVGVNTGSTSPAHALDVNGNVKATDYILEAINKQTSYTNATSIFVYDTSLDSDGGAWRKRTQNTSWYNETLNTSTRGSRKEFPAVAVILGRANDVVILDGDDPDLPMWMVFTAGANGLSGSDMVQYAGNPHPVAMKNGYLVIGHKTGGDNWGSPIISFISDIAKRTDPHGGEGGVWKGDISTRNDNSGYGYPGAQWINRNSSINDVAMVVDGTCKVDPRTGLPFPMIAFATDSGISVIMGSIDSLRNYYRTSDDDVHNISFGGSRLYAGMELGAVYVHKNPSRNDSDQSGNPASDWDVYGGRQNNNTYKPNLPLIGAPSDTEAIKGGFAVGSNFTNYSFGRGLCLVNEYPSDKNRSLIARIGPNYNTGWLPGHCLLSAFSSTSTTSPSNLLTNGDFSNGTTGWNGYSDSTISVSGGVATVTAPNGGSVKGINQVISGLSVGQQYTYQCTLLTSASGDYRIQISGIGLLSSSGQWVGPGNARVFGSFVATSTSHTLEILNYANVSAGFTYQVDDAIFQEGMQDYSFIENSPVEIQNTLTRTAVATGSELVGFKGQDATHRVIVPWDSSMNIGTGDFTFMTWAKKIGGYTTNHYLFDRANIYGDSAGRTYFIINNGYHRFRLAGGSEVTMGAETMELGEWTLITFTRINGAMSFGFNDRFVSSNVTGSNYSASFDSGATALRAHLGGYNGSWAQDYTMDGGYALMRLSNRGITKEQLEKIYADEKRLFTANSNCTLYGSSHAVDFLSYDNEQELLHVGNGQGRSVFSNLNRIDNTTTAVDNGLDVVNGFIVED